MTSVQKQQLRHSVAEQGNAAMASREQGHREHAVSWQASSMSEKGWVLLCARDYHPQSTSDLLRCMRVDLLPPSQLSPSSSGHHSLAEGQPAVAIIHWQKLPGPPQDAAVMMGERHVIGHFREKRRQID
jgi:hypothetical protein